MNNKLAVKKLLDILKGYKKSIVVILICLILSTLLTLCIPLISKSIMDDGFIGGNRKLLLKLIIISGIVYGVNFAIEIYKEKKRVNILAEIQYMLSEKAYLHLMKIKMNYFNLSNYSEIMTNVNTDIANISSIADERFFFVVSQIFSIIGGTIGLLLIDYRMTLIVLIFIPLKYIVMWNFAKNKRKITNDFMLGSCEYAKWFGNTLAGVREVRMFNLFEVKHKEFKSKRQYVIHTQKRMNILGLLNFQSDRIIVQLLTFMLYIVGSDLILNLELSIGSVFAFVTYSAYVTGPISAILNIGYLLAGIIPSTKRYYDFLAIEEEKDGEKKVNDNFEYIKFQNVDFEYENSQKVLKKSSFLISRGGKYAFIGENGSGKSTILSLILRLYEPLNGEILLNGYNISKYSLVEYRKMFSIVSQEIYLFDDTIRNNICLYKEMEDKVILQACADSGLDDFNYPNFLDCRVGVNGGMLSGGQKQKIALARALIYETPIIVFDEATSNADIQSEIKINELLETRLKEKTVIIVTHRQEVLDKVEHIYIVENGTIKEKQKVQIL